MNQGRLVFAQLMRHLPLSTFRRCVARYQGEFKVQSFSCLDQFLCMAFAQLTYRESLRDIEACLRAQHGKLYHLGIRSTVARNTLANANAVRDWRIFADFAQRLIAMARTLYAQDSFGIDLQETVYALDTTTIDLCLSVFPWAPFRAAKAAVKLHTLLDLRGNIPTFIHISHGKMHEVKVLDQLLPEAGAFYVMDRGFLDFERLFRFHEAGSFFITRARARLRVQRRYSRPVNRSSGVLCDWNGSGPAWRISAVWYGSCGTYGRTRRSIAQEAVRVEYHGFLYAETLTATQIARESFLLKWKQMCPRVEASQVEAGEHLRTFNQLLANQWLSARTSNAIGKRTRSSVKERIPRRPAERRRCAESVFRVVVERADETAPQQKLPWHWGRKRKRPQKNS